MKELCEELGWCYSCFVEPKYRSMYIGINQVILSNEGFPHDCNVIWEFVLIDYI
jgi:hypothetical protein